MCTGDNMLAKRVPVLSCNDLQKTNNYQSSNYHRRPTKLLPKSSSNYASLKKYIHRDMFWKTYVTVPEEYDSLI